MTHLIISSAVCIAFALRDFLDQFVNCLLIIAEGQEHGFQTCVLDIDQLCSILFLRRERILVLLDTLLFVVFVVSEADQSFLGVVAHRHLVDVHALGIILDDELVRDELLQIVAALLVDLHVVGVAVRRQIDLRLVAVQERLGVAVGHLSGLLSVEHVVGWRKKFLQVVGVAEVSSKRANFNHRAICL